MKNILLISFLFIAINTIAQTNYIHPENYRTKQIKYVLPGDYEYKLKKNSESKYVTDSIVSYDLTNMKSMFIKDTIAPLSYWTNIPKDTTTYKSFKHFAETITKDVPKNDTLAIVYAIMDWIAFNIEYNINAENIINNRNDNNDILRIVNYTLNNKKLLNEKLNNGDIKISNNLNYIGKFENPNKNEHILYVYVEETIINNKVHYDPVNICKLHVKEIIQPDYLVYLNKRIGVCEHKSQILVLTLKELNIDASYVRGSHFNGYTEIINNLRNYKKDYWVNTYDLSTHYLFTKIYVPFHGWVKLKYNNQYYIIDVTKAKYPAFDNINNYNYKEQFQTDTMFKSYNSVFNPKLIKELNLKDTAKVGGYMYKHDILNYIITPGEAISYLYPSNKEDQGFVTPYTMGEIFDFVTTNPKTYYKQVIYYSKQLIFNN